MEKLLSSDRRRAAVEDVVAPLNLFEHWACKVLDQPRCTQRRRVTRAGNDRVLINRMKELSVQNPR